MDVFDLSVARGDAPERSMSQRMAALERANEIRKFRADVKRDLKKGRARVTDLLVDYDERLAGMKVFDLVLAVPKVGRGKADRILRRELISPSKTVGGLSPRQRMALVAALRPYALAVRSARRMDA